MLVITVHTKFRETMNPIFFVRSFTQEHSVIIYRPNELLEGNVFICVCLRTEGWVGIPGPYPFQGVWVCLVPVLGRDVSRGWVCPGERWVCSRGRIPTSPPLDMEPEGVGFPPLLTSNGCRHTYGWQAVNTHPTGMLSCLSRYVSLPGLHKLEIRNSASKFQPKRSTLIHIGSTNSKQIWQGEQMTHVK